MAAQAQTIRLKILKIGAVITRNTQRIGFMLSSHYPFIEKNIPKSTHAIIKVNYSYKKLHRSSFIKYSNKGCTPVIPSKKNRKQPREYDRHIYKERHLIESFFGKIKHFGRIFSRFDKTSTSFMAFLNFVGTFI